MLVASAFMLVKGKPDDRRPESLQVVNALLFIVLQWLRERGTVNLWSQNVEHVI
jgi:hypothetical protein